MGQKSAFDLERKRVESVELVEQVVAGSIAVALLHMGTAAVGPDIRRTLVEGIRRTGHIVARRTCRTPVDPVEVDLAVRRGAQTTVLALVGTRKLPG